MSFWYSNCHSIVTAEETRTRVGVETYIVGFGFDIGPALVFARTRSILLQ